MKISTIINKFFQNEFETTDRKTIEDIWGERIKPVAGTNDDRSGVLSDVCQPPAFQTTVRRSPVNTQNS